MFVIYQSTNFYLMIGRVNFEYTIFDIDSYIFETSELSNSQKVLKHALMAAIQKSRISLSEEVGNPMEKKASLMLKASKGEKKNRRRTKKLSVECMSKCGSYMGALFYFISFSIHK